MKQGRYVHPGGAPVTRCYGYVGNVVDQVMTILNRRDGSLDRKTFYVGDPPDDIYQWTNAFSLALTGKKVRVVPRPVLRSVGLVGDVVIAAGGKFPAVLIPLSEHDRRLRHADGTDLCRVRPPKVHPERGCSRDGDLVENSREFLVLRR